MQDQLVFGVGDVLGRLIYRSRDLVLERQLANVLFERTHRRIVRTRGRCRTGRPGDVEVGSVVVVDLERVGVARLARQQVVHAAALRPDRSRRVAARDGHAMAAGVRRPGACVMVALVGREHEQRVVLVDAVRREPLEGSLVGLVLLLELIYVLGLTGGERLVRGRPRVVGVLDVRVRHRDPRLLHRGHVAERLRRGGAEAGEARVARLPNLTGRDRLSVVAEIRDVGAELAAGRAVAVDVVYGSGEVRNVAIRLAVVVLPRRGE